MIVKVDSTNFEQYRDFFAEAYKYLEEIEAAENRNIIANEDRSEEKTFTSIAQYFRYIEEFNNSARRDYFLLKLPLDEGMFNIDANTRLIDIPASFVKSAIIQKDKVAETIIFTINRFIDNVDLCNVERIYVQWTAPDGNGGVREWATPVELIDRESIAEKIKFGWTIDEAVTLYPGKVSFAVTFFIPDESQVGKVLYRLNTLPVSFEVKPALQPEINANSVINRPGNALNAVIRNNRYPGVGVKAPLVPDFNDPGLDLPSDGMLMGEGAGTLTLKAQAVTNDTGIINYNWYFVPAEGGAYRYRCGEKEVTDSDNNINYSFMFKPQIKTATGIVDNTLSAIDYNLLTNDSKDLFEKIDTEGNNYKLKTSTTDEVEVFYNNIGTVGTSYEIISNTETINPRDKIYVKDIDGSFKLYTAEDKKEEEETGIPLTKYEKYTLFTVASSGDVVGEYYVEADNTISPNTSLSQASTSCYLEGPEDIVILPEGNLESNVFIENPYTYIRGTKISQSEYDLILDSDEKNKFTKIEEDGNTYYSTDTTVTVTIRKINLTLELSQVKNTTFTYDWYRSLTEPPVDLSEDDEFGTKIPSISGSTASISDVGWYQVKVSAKKNRKEKKASSIICRALLNPVAPTLNVVKYDENNQENTSSIGTFFSAEDGSETYVIDGNKDSKINLVVNGQILIDDIDKKNDKLYSDGIKYEWRIYNKDKGEFEVLNTLDHGNLIPSVDNPNFVDTQFVVDAQGNTFSSHPSKIIYKFDGNPVFISCFAINTLYNKNTVNESIAALFEIK